MTSVRACLLKGENSSTIYPSHSCFTDAMEFLNELAKRESPALRDGTIILIHALCTFDDGSLFAHAWIEDRVNRVAIFKGILDGQLQFFAGDIEEYRQNLRVVEETEYTPEQACRENYRTGMLGPWQEKFRPYLRNRQEPPAGAKNEAASNLRGRRSSEHTTQDTLL